MQKTSLFRDLARGSIVSIGEKFISPLMEEAAAMTSRHESENNVYVMSVVRKCQSMIELRHA